LPSAKRAEAVGDVFYARGIAGRLSAGERQDGETHVWNFPLLLSLSGAAF
jgi:hypothetical protein